MRLGKTCEGDVLLTKKFEVGGSIYFHDLVCFANMEIHITWSFSEGGGVVPNQVHSTLLRLYHRTKRSHIKILITSAGFVAPKDQNEISYVDYRWRPHLR